MKEVRDEKTDVTTAGQKRDEAIVDIIRTDLIPVRTANAEIILGQDIGSQMATQLKSMIKNCSDTGLSSRRFVRATVDNLEFSFPGLRAPQMVKSITGLVMHHHECRFLHPDGPIGGKFPLCKSDDGVRGDGTPGGICVTLHAGRRQETCPYAKFGPNNEQPRCKDYVFLYVFSPDRNLLFITQIPGTSRVSINKEIERIEQFNSLCTVPVRISLAPFKGKRYNVAIMTPDGDPLTGKHAAAAEELSEKLKELLRLGRVIPASGANGEDGEKV